MRELNAHEMNEVQGGWFWVVGIAGRFVTNQLVKHYIGNAGTVYGVYSWAKSTRQKP